MAYELAAKIWSLKQTVFGAERALRHYCRRLPIVVPKDARILDVGCGTGTMGLAFLEMNPTTTLVATDLNVDMLRHTRRRGCRIDPTFSRVTIGISNIERPEQVSLFGSNTMITLAPQSFNVVIAGAVLEHTDIDVALAGLTRLLKPHGFLLLNIMKRAILPMISSALYNFKPLSVDDVVSRLRKLEYTAVSVIPFTIHECALNFYRVGILARK